MHLIFHKGIPLALCLTWMLTTACGAPTPDEPSSDEGVPAAQAVHTIYPDWSANEVYTAGDIVVHDGKYYRALWWSRGHEPKEEARRDEWQCLGDVPLQNSGAFSDVPDGAWFAGAVNALAERGVLSGTGAGFRPSRPVTRAQFAVMLCRALQIEPTEQGDNFADAGDTWYTPYLATLKQQDLLSADEEGNFRPDHYITRQEACQLIYNTCNGFAEDPGTVFAPYIDADDVASWAIQPLSWCLERDIIQGDDNMLLPEATATRAEAAQIVYNVLQWYEK